MMKHKIYLCGEQIRLRDAVLMKAKLAIKTSSPEVRTNQVTSEHIIREYDNSDWGVSGKGIDEKYANS